MLPILIHFLLFFVRFLSGLRGIQQFGRRHGLKTLGMVLHHVFQKRQCFVSEPFARLSFLFFKVKLSQAEFGPGRAEEGRVVLEDLAIAVNRLFEVACYLRLT